MLLQSRFVSLQVVLSAQAGQEIHFESYDKDLDSDDFLGRFVPCVCGIFVVVVFLYIWFKVKVLVKVINSQLDKQNTNLKIECKPVCNTSFEKG